MKGNGIASTVALAIALSLAGTASAEFFNNIKIPMRDGVNLAGDLYLPTNRAEKVGCFMLFSPYNATGPDKPYCPARAEEWGVATIAVDCRGRGHAEGVFEPWEERLTDDADDLLKWISSQPWSNGKVVTVGGSYPGHTQLACLKSANPALVACAPSVITFNPHSLNFTHGALITAFMQKWHTGMSSAASWEELSRHPDRNDPYWMSRCSLGKLSEAKGRALCQAGWFDMLGVETFDSFALMPEGSFLRVGPWSHGVNTFDKPDIDYRKVPAATVIEELEVDFLRSALEGRESPAAKFPGKFEIFVMGANVWRIENEWPLKRTVYRKLYFDENLGLSFDAPKGAQGEDPFDYDPENPVPTKGGRIIGNGGQFSQAEIEARKDVLSYTTGVLEDSVEVTGNVMASIVAKSTAKVADVAVKLVDVYPDGTPYNVSTLNAAFASAEATQGTVTLGEGVFEIDSQLLIGGGITVVGQGWDKTIIKQVAATATANTRVMTVEGGATVERLTITGGKVTGSNYQYGGGALVMDGTISWCCITNNMVYGNNTKYGGGVRVCRGPRGADRPFDHCG